MGKTPRVGGGKEVSKGAMLKAAVLVVFVVVAAFGVRHTEISRYLSPASLEGVLAAAGRWAPAVFVAFYAFGVCVFVPGTVLTGLGALIFGPYWGFVYVWLGAMLGASVAFWIGRTLGRDFAASLIGDKLRRYDDAIERNGFATVLYLRLIYFPFTPMNFGMGLTKVRFVDYLAGTGLGILVGTFIFTFLIGTLKQIWAEGRWQDLATPRVLGAVALFVASFFIPLVVKKLRGEGRQQGE
ncbi:Uncharacterized membrane protein YdjX, TVP38/TMEM64 family, SNARE-associated domain [Desulfacinum hydrothermale DSM 13146]|uniref:TVP38/TMEM64 family membrane protein n=1 Tax=Desulfacinum hydrothermale DSM 13146 TaxID=1121390 RepID=A0A1W1XTL4_9BACT|nr:TVP38/TMEM64 family protein [Desulfacinum hydrothermale]SMC26881.1 Uncharacterized membrane protein YdjX, TVP38/TMEM64 family, SNARE-associated domain [Desulfacinum hydrothermale DSM 13146]